MGASILKSSHINAKTVQANREAKKSITKAPMLTYETYTSDIEDNRVYSDNTSMQQLSPKELRTLESTITAAKPVKSKLRRV